jgi:homoserine dehydrogenase
VSVYPTLIPNAHVLASVNHVFNAVFVRGDVVGDTLFYGRGRVKMPLPALCSVIWRMRRWI